MERYRADPERDAQLPWRIERDRFGLLFSGRPLAVGEVVKVVPAELLQGAVEALREAYGYIWHDEIDAALVHVEHALRAAGVDPSTERGR